MEAIGHFLLAALATQIFMCPITVQGQYICTPEGGDYLPFVDYAMRLAGCGSDITLQAGRLEIYYKNQWGTVCWDNFDENDASVACYNLGFARQGAISLKGSFGPGTGEIMLKDVGCYGNETALDECKHSSWLQTTPCTHAQDVSLACVDQYNGMYQGYPTRLYYLNESEPMIGRLEIFHKGCWGTVCDDGFNNVDAGVACRSINPRYRKGFVIPQDEVHYGPGEGKIWLDEVNCQPDDINIGYCAHDPWNVHDCSHYEDVAIRCEYSGCDLEPCRNGATCEDVPDNEDDYICVCDDGYYGPQCQYDRCSNVTCYNGGTCQMSGPICRCPPFYTGQYCETMIGGCDSAPCLNGGTCFESGTNHTCECGEHYTGQNCETVIGGCESDPCLNNATCIEDGYNFECVCEPDYTGDTCDRLLLGCEIERCLNGGTCLENGTLFTCVCDEWYTGTICETEFTGCDFDPCMNGGTCTDDGGRDYTCLCDDMYTGENCEGVIGGCEEDRCENGATCIEDGPMFTCECPIGYTGPLCEEATPPSACGDILHFIDINSLPPPPTQPQPPPTPATGWNTMCYLGNSERDRQFWNYTCRDLLINTYYGGYPGVDLEGAFGCHPSAVFPDEEFMYNACKDGHSHDLSISSNSTYVMMSVCIAYYPFPPEEP